MTLRELRAKLAEIDARHLDVPVYLCTSLDGEPERQYILYDIRIACYPPAQKVQLDIVGIEP